ncbi:MAG: hypothetical protein KGL39_19740 [Patescibacteria group bacterium]|nr:hypothetical protein [Patescibacteria group bacterium]
MSTQPQETAEELVKRLLAAHAKIEGPLSCGSDVYGGYVKDARGDFCTGIHPNGKPDIEMAEFIVGAWTYLPDICKALEASLARERELDDKYVQDMMDARFQVEAMDVKLRAAEERWEALKEWLENDAFLEEGLLNRLELKAKIDELSQKGTEGSGVSRQ